MKGICFRCKKEIKIEIDDKKRRFSFLYPYKGIELSIELFRFPNECRECAESDFLRDFKNYVEEYDLLSVKEGEVRVNWETYINMSGTYVGDKMTEILMSIGILSTKRLGNWDIVSSYSVGLNPWYQSQIYLYFKRKLDAVEYSRLKWGDTLYHWWLKKEEKNKKHLIIDKKDVLKLIC